MKRNKLLVTLFSISIFFTACKKDDNGTTSGDNWTSIATVNGGLPCRIEFPTENIGYMCGSDNGFMAKTINGGVTWTALPSPDGPSSISSMYALCFLNKDTGYVGVNGNVGRIYKTINGGDTWTVSCPASIGSEAVLFVNDIYFTTALNGVATTRFGRIVHTTDGGQTWEFAAIDHYFNLVLYYGISFVDDNVGYVVGDFSTVLKTTDGGATWVTINNYNLNTTQTVLDGGGQFYDVHAVDANTIIISSSTAGIFRSGDGGATWAQVHTSQCTRLGFDSSSHGFAAGTNGNTPFVHLFETTDAGLTWNNIVVGDMSIIFRDFVMVKSGLGFSICDHQVFKYEN